MQPLLAGFWARLQLATFPFSDLAPSILKLEQDHVDALNLISAVNADSIIIAGTSYNTSLVITPTAVVPWPAKEFAALTAEDFEFLCTLGADIVLLATGQTQRFVHPRLSQALAAKRIGLECMTLGPACRTYNLLASEGRQAACAVLFA